MNSLLRANSSILELNAGTGEDAVYFASLGHHVHATDISPAMQEQLKKKVAGNGVEQHVTWELCSYTELEKLASSGPYDHIFSNFAGLNCTAELSRVLDRFHSLLKPGGIVTLVVLPKFCLWEFLLLFRGKAGTAFRRFSGSRGTRAHIEGVHFRCWYYNPGYIRKHLDEQFVVRNLEGLCSIVPPSYMDRFATKYPVLFRRLVKWENRLKCAWPWRSMGDYYILSLQKKEEVQR
jgi:SAM-dependent methyltransferase